MKGSQSIPYPSTIPICSWLSSLFIQTCRAAETKQGLLLHPKFRNTYGTLISLSASDVFPTNITVCRRMSFVLRWNGTSVLRRRATWKIVQNNDLNIRSLLRGGVPKTRCGNTFQSFKFYTSHTTLGNAEDIQERCSKCC